MSDPKGRIFVPIATRPDGSLHGLELTVDDFLRVNVENTNLVETPHVLLDGAINLDTVAHTPVKGDIIVGTVQGDASLKWQALARGSTGQVLTVKSDGTLEWATASGGKLVQVQKTETGAVATGTTTMPFDDTIPQITEGDEYMTCAITPTNASNILKIDVVAFIANSATNDGGIALFQDAVANALAAICIRISAANIYINGCFTHYMVAGTTSPITFRVRAGCAGAGTTTFNGQAGARKFGGVMASSITVSELLP